MVSRATWLGSLISFFTLFAPNCTKRCASFSSGPWRSRPGKRRLQPYARASGPRRAEVDVVQTVVPAAPPDEGGQGLVVPFAVVPLTGFSHNSSLALRPASAYHNRCVLDPLKLTFSAECRRWTPERIVLLLPRTPWPGTAALLAGSTDSFSPSRTSEWAVRASPFRSWLFFRLGPSCFCGFSGDFTAALLSEFAGSGFAGHLTGFMSQLPLRPKRSANGLAGLRSSPPQHAHSSPLDTAESGPLFRRLGGSLLLRP